MVSAYSSLWCWPIVSYCVGHNIMVSAHMCLLFYNYGVGPYVPIVVPYCECRTMSAYG